jgi:hypothetical protein
MTTTLAMMMCIRNESAMLREHLSYHHFLGVQRAYVFLDRCTDDSAQIAASFPWVTVLDQPHNASADWMEAYQNACARVALELARSDQIEWLMHLDIDEFAWGDNTVAEDDAEAGNLLTMLGRQASGTEMVVLPTWEVLPILLPAESPFWMQEYFQTSTAISRDVLDPGTDRLEKLTKWMGHNQGKSIVRTSAAAAPLNQHRWRGLHSELKTTTTGRHYHFIVTSAEHWQSKYQKLSEEASHWPNGEPVPFPKQAWKKASMTFLPEEAARYYDRWVAITPAQAEKYTSEGKAVRDRHVQRVLCRLSTAEEQ